MKKLLKIAVWPIGLLMIVLLFLLCTFRIPEGTTGVVTRFGAVAGTTTTSGLHFKAPFITKVYIMDNRVTKVEVSSSAASKDLQTVSSNVAVSYILDKDNSENMFKTVGTSYQTTIINPAIQEVVKGVTAKFTAEELVTKRGQVSDEIKVALDDKISAYGLDIREFNILDFDFSEEFNKAVESKQTAQQNALKAEQDLTRIKVEAEQQIEQAKAEAEALRLKSKEVNQDMVKLEWIKKWDGKLPTVQGSGNIMDLTDIINDKK